MYKPYNKATADGRELYFLTDSWLGDTYAPARIICYDRKSNDNASLVILAETKPGFEYFLVLNDDGTDCYEKQRLFMAPVKMEAWVNVYRAPDGGIFTGGGCYRSKEEAEKTYGSNTNYVKTLLVHEWEE